MTVSHIAAHISTACTDLGHADALSLVARILDKAGLGTRACTSDVPPPWRDGDPKEWTARMIEKIEQRDARRKAKHH